jgi:hypothetical protein
MMKAAYESAANGWPMIVGGIAVLTVWFCPALRWLNISFSASALLQPRDEPERAASAA